MLIIGLFLHDFLWHAFGRLLSFSRHAFISASRKFECVCRSWVAISYDVSFWSFLSALSLYCRRMYRIRSISGPMSNPPKRNSIWRPSLNPNSMAHLAEINAQTTFPLINAWVMIPPFFGYLSPEWYPPKSIPYPWPWRYTRLWPVQTTPVFPSESSCRQT